jgi:general secretion pathway protein A
MSLTAGPKKALSEQLRTGERRVRSWGGNGKDVFIERYKLDRNPFSEDTVRPLFVSQSMRMVSAGVRQVSQGAIQSFYVTGAAGVGKTTLLTHRVRSFRDVPSCWVSPDIDTAEAFLSKLLHDFGLGSVEGSLGEMRGILEVYLKHQRAKANLCVVIIDGVERHSPEVMRELESLCEIRMKSLPILQCVLLTRNEDLVDHLMSQHKGGRQARALHARLTGFNPEETASYIRACLQGAGCDWAHELIPDNVLFDIQAYTQGVVGDINALCCESLEVLAAEHASKQRPPRVTKSLLKKIATTLNLRYDPEPWQPKSEESLSPEAVQVSQNWGLRLEAAHLVVTSEGKKVKEITLNRPRMVLGRDRGCDISLDSHYLSRYQNLFMETERGWLLIDLNSTNGCFVNGRRVQEHRLKDGDLIAVGQHQLRFMSGAESGTYPQPGSLQNTPTDATLATDMSEAQAAWRAGPKRASTE